MFPAIYEVHTMTDVVPCCAIHASKLQALMAILGTRVVVSVIAELPGDKECSNCVNEHKKSLLAK